MSFSIYVQQLHKEYISLSWSRYSRVCGSYHNFLNRGCCLQGNYYSTGCYWLSWSHHFESFKVATMTWLTATEYLCYKWPRICSICREHFPVFPHSWLITGFVTGSTRRLPLVEQELLTFPEHRSSPPIFSGVRVTRSLVCRSLFVLLYFFLWSLCCLFFFDIRILITPHFLSLLHFVEMSILKPETLSVMYVLEVLMLSF